VPSYDAEVFRTDDPDEAGALRTELARSLLHGPGIIVIHGAMSTDVVDRATMAFRAMIDEQRNGTAVAGDHFAAPGANDRVWNALEKLALADPAAFIDYYANDVIATVASAWLGPAYQVTSQINLVNPGGQAQSPHRDYHLGFLSDDVAASYPPHVHRLSPLLTLQGAIAHCDMPVESGPTMYLPHSQKYAPGYVAWRRADFIDYFGRHRVQLPLRSVDAVFFNPAVFHAAGTNRTADVARMANLLQISSAFGRAMESVDRRAVTEAVFPTLCRRVAGGVARRAVDNVIAATAEGYPFPTNLDRDQPVDGLTPPSQADVLRRALDQTWTVEQLSSALDAHDHRRETGALGS
jgi:ectoine hydroxylase-related dioxygenase (phytanoyl-CoA dioxygenase family)